MRCWSALLRDNCFVKNLPKRESSFCCCLPVQTNTPKIWWNFTQNWEITKAESNQGKTSISAFKAKPARTQTRKNLHIFQAATAHKLAEAEKPKTFVLQKITALLLRTFRIAQAKKLFPRNIYIVASEAVLPETDIFWMKIQQAKSNPLFRQVFT